MTLLMHLLLALTATRPPRPRGASLFDLDWA
jgi:hypothetical protein